MSQKNGNITDTALPVSCRYGGRRDGRGQLVFGPERFRQPIRAKMNVPSGPGLGVVIDPEFVAKHKPVKM